MSFEILDNLFLLSDSINPREHALLFWLLLVTISGLFSRNVRPQLVGLIEAAFAKQLVVVYTSFAIYTGLITSLTFYLDLWSKNFLFATIVWFFTSGLVAISNFVGKSAYDFELKKTLISFVPGTIIVEFLISFETYNLIVEIILLPFIFFISFMLNSALYDDKIKLNQKVTNFLILLLVAILLLPTVAAIFKSPQNFLNLETLKAFSFPIILDLLSIPFFYFIFCYSIYENCKLTINLKSFQSEELKKYAKNRFVYLFFRPDLLKKVSRDFQLMPAKSVADVDQILIDTLKFQRRKTSNIPDEQNDGWSPFKAKHFFKEIDLVTNDYHKSFDGEEWWAESPSNDFGLGLMSLHTVTYRFYGSEYCVNKLKLTGVFYNDSSSEEKAYAKEQFKLMALDITL